MQPDRRTRRKEETRRRIMQAALELFSRQEYTQTTVEQIAEAADIGKGTFFNYFPTKEHVLAGFGEMQIERGEEILAQAQAEGWPVRELLWGIWHNVAETTTQHPMITNNLLVASCSTQVTRQGVADRRRYARERLTEIFAFAQQREEIRTQLPADILAHVYLQCYYGTLHCWSVNPEHPLETMLHAAFTVFWEGITTEHRTAEAATAHV